MTYSVHDIISELIIREGGYVNRLSDKGGPTKYGITLRTLQTYRRNKLLTCEDVKALKMSEAHLIYLTVYYYDSRCNKLPQVIQPIILDMNVNHGTDDSTLILQKSLNQVDSFLRIKEDSILGSKTINACNALCIDHLKSVNLVNTLVKNRNLFLLSIANRDPTQKEYIKGWLARSNKFKLQSNFDSAQV